MIRKRWLWLTLLVGALALGIAGGTALAQGDGNGGDSSIKSFVSRVADILGLEESRVQDTFNQARKELKDDRLKARLQGLVGKGTLTQEEADEYIEWYQSRPDTLPGRGFFSGRRGHGKFGGHGFGTRMRHGWGFKDKPAPDSPEDTSV